TRTRSALRRSSPRADAQGADMDWSYPLPVYGGSGGDVMRPLPVSYTGGEMMYPTSVGAPILVTDPVPEMRATVMPVATDAGFGSVRSITDLAKKVLGTAQVDIRFGGGEP